MTIELAWCLARNATLFEKKKRLRMFAALWRVLTVCCLAQCQMDQFESAVVRAAKPRDQLRHLPSAFSTVCYFLMLEGKKLEQMSLRRGLNARRGVAELGHPKTFWLNDGTNYMWQCHNRKTVKWLKTGKDICKRCWKSEWAVSKKPFPAAYIWAGTKTCSAAVPRHLADLLWATQRNGHKHES